ncbi:hypothetical protein GCM10008090_14460 [Arenicella chitinivorans]|uniref:Uncharacterized protein n=1 Tax=Arenicella chitinivorans TaxID=1329800 RepID=A0A918RNF2_9GAMM|nr:hypothetical protein [Arenicella chitinivorans]GHA05928.1 hypothetical protein GCM10008090_14460 [Arenicella chitinivorans]
MAKLKSTDNSQATSPETAMASKTTSSEPNLPPVRRKRHYAQNLANIVHRLPFHQQLSASQSLLLKLTPVWHDWCEQQRKQRGKQQFSATNDAQLSHIEQERLTISCRNQHSATMLNHLKVSLLTAIHHAGFQQIQQIKIRMALQTHTGAQHSSEAMTRLPLKEFVNRKKPPVASIQSVEAVQHRVKHEPLAKALERLAQTLKSQ